MRSEQLDNKQTIQKYYKTSEETERAGIPVFHDPETNNVYLSTDSMVQILGKTGVGKSTSVTYNFMKEIAHKKESALYVTKKSEEVTVTKREFEKCGYKQIYIINLANPSESNTYNIFSPITKKLRSGDPQRNQQGRDLISNLTKNLIPIQGQQDIFWPTAARELFEGLCNLMFDLIKDENYINLKTLVNICNHLEDRETALLKIQSIYRHLPDDYVSKNLLSTYVNSPNDTRRSIYASLKAFLSGISNNDGVLNLLSGEDLFGNIKINKPYIIYILLPASSNSMDDVGGAISSQLIDLLMYESEMSFEKIRVNIVLEELGSVGKSISTLPELMSYGRSYGFKFILCLQSSSQLDDIYGVQKAQTIRSNIGLTIGFATDDLKTLEEYSQRLGETLVERNGCLVWERLRSPSQFASMPAGVAFIYDKGQMKFFSHLPYYFDFNKKEKLPNKIIVKKKNNEVKSKNLDELLNEARILAHDGMFSTKEERRPHYGVGNGLISQPPNLPPTNHDIDAMLDDIDKRLKELDEQEAKYKNSKVEQIDKTKKNGKERNKVIEYMIGIQEINKNQIDDVAKFLIANVPGMYEKEHTKVVSKLKEIYLDDERYESLVVSGFTTLNDAKDVLKMAKEKKILEGKIIKQESEYEYLNDE